MCEGWRCECVSVRGEDVCGGVSVNGGGVSV